jgi:hypothetical protein
MAHVTFVDGDDWEGLYVDGQLVTQGHTVSLKEAAEVFMQAQPVSAFDTRFADTQWLSEVGQLPDKLRDVQFLGEADSDVGC